VPRRIVNDFETNSGKDVPQALLSAGAPVRTSKNVKTQRYKPRFWFNQNRSGANGIME
jgi:hypothetical protein